MSEELKEFNIKFVKIPESDDLFKNIHQAINEMKRLTLKNNFEVVLNNNLIKVKEKLTNYHTIFGCRISYADLEENISFIIREDIEPSYEELQKELSKEKEKVSKAIGHINACKGINGMSKDEVRYLLDILGGINE